MEGATFQRDPAELARLCRMEGEHSSSRSESRPMNNSVEPLLPLLCQRNRHFGFLRTVPLLL